MLTGRAARIVQHSGHKNATVSALMSVLGSVWMFTFSQSRRVRYLLKMRVALS